MTLPGWAQLAVALFAALGGAGGVVALVKVLPEARKIDAEAEKAGADAAKVIGETAALLLKPATDEAARLAARLESTERHLEAADRKIRQLERQVDGLTDRLKLAHRLLSDAGIPFPPVEGP